MYENPQMKFENLEDVPGFRPACHSGRCLVVAFFASFVAFLVALWLTGIFTSNPTWLFFPPWSSLSLFALRNRWLVLVLPAIALACCYLALRWRTGEIMAVPDRYLDERQRMVRDQAHRSAFRLLKFSVVLLPLALILVKLQSTALQTPGYVSIVRPLFLALAGQSSSGHMATGFTIMVQSQTGFFYLSPSRIQIVSPSTPEIALAGGLLLLCLLLLFSALPMAILAWKGKM